MERYEIGDDERLAAMVAAARRGEEAAFTQDGTVVAVIEPHTSALLNRWIFRELEKMRCKKFLSMKITPYLRFFQRWNL